MDNLLAIQYGLVQRVRETLLNFLEKEVKTDLLMQVAVFNNQSVFEMMEHIGRCYISWLAYFAMKRPPYDLVVLHSPEGLKKLFGTVNEVVHEFAEQYKDRMDETVTGIHRSCGALRVTPEQLLTHVITHEFHHKGQIVSMCRMLGHPPPDTDVSLFFEQV